MNLLADTKRLFARHARSTGRNPGFLIAALLQPLLWLSLFSQLFGKVDVLPGFGGVSYLQFLTPGIMITTALFSSATSGLGILNDLNRGVVDRMLVTPVNDLAIIAARVVHVSLIVTLQSAAILVLALFLGAGVPGGPVGVALAMLAAALLGGGFGALSNGLALLTRRQETLISIVNLVTLPLTFLSSTLISEALLPDWMRVVASFNPVNWAVLIARSGIESEGMGSVVGHLTLLIGFAAVCWVLAAQAFAMYRRTI